MATPKKKHLIELMIEAGVKWPDGAEYAAQDKRDLYVWFYSEKPKFAGVNEGKWTSYVDYESGRKCLVVDGEKLNTICCDWHQTIVTREQYAEAVSADATMTPVAQQEAQPAPKYCASVMRQMPDETIESLLSEIKAKREERDVLVAKAEVLALEISGIELQVNDKLKEYGFVVLALSAPSEPEQPEITDWRDLRVGDVVEITSVHKPSLSHGHVELIGTEATVVSVGAPELQDLVVASLNGTLYIDGFRFIRRP